MITLMNVSKSFGEKKILDAISLTINTGARIALTGVSGCGKTTLLRLIAGLDVPDEGEIKLSGELANFGTEIRIPPHRRKVGLVFQSSALWPHMNVEQNILFGLGGTPKTRRIETLDAILARTGTTHLAKRMPDTLSGGEQRRVAIARTLAPEPEILLMDEPLTNLDLAAREEMAALIRGITESSVMTLVYVTHEVEEAASFCDEQYILKGGKLAPTSVPRRRKST